MSGEQLQLFHLDRSSPASVAALLRLPEASSRSFVVASALGRFFDHDGSFKEVRSLKEIGGSFVGLKQRGRILQALNIGSRRWRELVTDWESRYVAHRCGPSGVALFAKPLLESCPVCNAYIEITDTPPHPSARRRNGSSTAAQTAVVVPSSGTNTAAEVAPTPPLVGTESTHPISGDLLGIDKGIEKRVGQ